MTPAAGGGQPPEPGGADSGGTAGPPGTPGEAPPGAGAPGEASLPVTAGPELPAAAGAMDLDLLAAALRADTGDLDAYARVLLASLADALPAGVLEVTRERSMADRLGGRPGRVTALRVSLAGTTLELSSGRHGLVATTGREVRGVAISRRPVSLEQWASLLAEQLRQLAAESAAARAALGRLLGAE